MAFLDDLGKKITEASQSVVQMGKDFTDSAKYSSMVSEEEKAIDSVYIEIGKRYMDKYDGNYDAELGELVKKVKESQAKIVEYRTKIQELKNITPCPTCGTEVQKNALFCPSCGGKMPVVEAPKPASTWCSQCGAEIAPGLKFCTSCGAQV